MRHRFAARFASAAGAGALAVLSIMTLDAGGAAAAGGAIPDPSAKGFIGLCDTHDHNVTGGSVRAKPFVWKAVASVPPPKALLGRGENAVLNIYQPRPGVAPGDWSGDQLTAATFYYTPRAPSTQATLKDSPLSLIVKEFPPLVDGLYELRMYFGKSNAGLYSATYPATFIRVTGDHWNVVSGGTVNCAASSGQSAEVLMGVVPGRKAYGTAPPRRPHGQPSSVPTHATGAASDAPKNPSPSARTSASARASQSPVGNESAVGARAPAGAGGHGDSGSTNAIAWWVAALAVVVAAMAGGAWWRTRRRQAAMDLTGSARTEQHRDMEDESR